ncbi:MAG: twin-arginine translocase subunit TatC [Spirochaetes bacterium]|nr:twin-arginine translocase subunit TatC [Spirochaetota bacterium]
MGKNLTMPFWGHVYELRRRVLVVAAALAVFSVAGYVVFPMIFDVISQTLTEDLYVTALTEGFVTRLRIAVLIGAFLALPILVFEVAAFIFPALSRRERRFMLLLLLSSFILFVGGMAFGFQSVLPISIRFLRSETFFPQNLHRLLSYQDFISFLFTFLLGFGLCFEFPVVLLFLLKVRILSLRIMIRSFRWFLIVILTVAAIMTPPDVVSQLMLALPMIVLYLLCILIGKLMRLGA